MLDLLRKRAQSWITVMVFAIIIVVFVFFFGYQDIQQGQAREMVAKVNGSPIAAGAFQLAVENNTAFYRERFKEELPEQIARGIRPSTLQQLINQKLLANLGRALGVRVAAEEVADKIRALPYLQHEGQFDTLFYTSVFLPQMQQRYRLDFEDLLREELLVEKTQKFLRETARVTPVEAREAFDQERTQWTFEVATVDGEALATEKKITEVGKAEAIAAELQAAFATPAVREKLLKTYGIAAKRVGPVPLSGRHQVLTAAAGDEAYHLLFALTPAQRIPAAPIRVGNKWMVVRLETVAKPTEGEWTAETAAFTERLQKEREEARLQAWLQRLYQHAAIRRYIDIDSDEQARRNLPSEPREREGGTQQASPVGGATRLRRQSDDSGVAEARAPVINTDAS